MERKLGDWSPEGRPSSSRVAYDEVCAEPLGGELNTADLGWCYYVSRHADHKQITQALIKHHLCRYA
jgi:hypothetical protein